MKNTCFMISSLILSLYILHLSSPFSISYYSNSNNDKITNLPNQPEVKFYQYSCYICVDKIQKIFLFYYFIEAEVQRTSKPIVMWLYGGNMNSTTSIKKNILKFNVSKNICCGFWRVGLFFRRTWSFQRAWSF